MSFIGNLRLILLNSNIPETKQSQVALIVTDWVTADCIRQVDPWQLRWAHLSATTLILLPWIGEKCENSSSSVAE
jgi:hypothetical protein